VVITPDERVSKVLQRDERLVDVFAAAAPAFSRLRSPVMRRTMARLVSVEQAARMAGLDSAELVARLNTALAELSGHAEAPAPAAPGRTEEKTTMNDTPVVLDIAQALATLPPERVVEADVREDLRNGQEPFSRIMAARQTVPADGVLKLRAIFEPVPLYRVMEKQGLEHYTEKLAEDDWVVWFYPAELESPAVGRRSEADSGSRVADSERRTQSLPATRHPLPATDTIILDVRGMEPPEPMVRTLAALETLPAGATLLQLNERVPQFLLPKLAELGFSYEVREQNDSLVRVFIRRHEGP
jgi:TusA-related sulfurtransferase